MENVTSFKNMTACFLGCWVKSSCKKWIKNKNKVAKRTIKSSQQVTSKYGLHAKSMKRWTLMNLPSAARVTSTRHSLSKRESSTETIVEWWLFQLRLHSLLPYEPAIFAYQRQQMTHINMVGKCFNLGNHSPRRTWRREHLKLKILSYKRLHQLTSMHNLPKWLRWRMNLRSCYEAAFFYVLALA